MNSIPVIAVFAGLSLLLTMVSIDAFASVTDKRMATNILLGQIEECQNSMQCNAKVFTGDIVKFTGMLTDRSGNPVRDKEVKIITLIPTPELVLLTSAITDDDGIFTAEWTAKFSKQKAAFQDVTRKFKSDSFEVFAEFTGDEANGPSRSNKFSITVTVNTVSTMLNSDKTLYNEGDTVVIFVAFLDSNDEFVDPESIHSTWNNQFIKLEKKKVGSYTFTIENLVKQHHQVVVVPEKQGFDASTAFLTIIVAGLR